MIYFTFDTNIWIDSISEGWTSTNDLDYIIHWIETNQIQLVLPQIIVDEWYNNKARKTKDGQKELLRFFQLANKVIPSGFLSPYVDGITQKKIIVDQLEKIESIIKTAQIIDVDDNVRKKVVDSGINKTAPFHNKKSFADALFIFSFLKFTSEHQPNQFYFISNNSSDFSAANKNIIHPHFEAEFTRLSIKYLRTLQSFKDQLLYREKLNLSSTFQTSSNLSDEINSPFNPEYYNLVADKQSSFIQNRETLLSIIKRESPSKEQIIFVLALVESDTTIQREFYSNLKSPSWLSMLTIKGVFEPKENKNIIIVDDKILEEEWYSLNYLKNLLDSDELKKDLQIQNDISIILEKICESPHDNSFSWSKIIELVFKLDFNFSKSILTNEKFLGNLLKSNFGNFIQTSTFISNIEIHLIDSTSSDKIELGEHLLQYILTLTDNNNEENHSPNFITIGNFECVSQISENSKFIAKLAEISSFKLINFIGRELIKLLNVESSDIQLKTKDDSSIYQVSSYIQEEYVLLRHKSKSSRINLKENLNEQTLQTSITDNLIKLGIPKNVVKHNPFEIEYLFRGILNGKDYYISQELLKGYDFHQDRIEVVYANLFLKILRLKTKNDFEGTKEYLLDLITKIDWRFTFFKKAFLIIIFDDWIQRKDLFWEMVKRNNFFNPILDSRYKDILFELLTENLDHFDSKDQFEFNALINEETDDINRLRWYSALNKTNYFQPKYLELSKKTGITKDLFGQQRVKITSGSIAPMTKEQFLRKKNQGITKFISEFNESDDRNGYTFDGFKRLLIDATTSKPNRVSGIVFKLKIPSFIYVYSIIHGLKNACASKHDFKWIEVLGFIDQYISTEEFINNDYITKNDRSRIDNIAVVRAIAELISKGARKDSKLFTPEVLNASINIMLKLQVYIIQGDKKLNDINDFVTYSFNSTSSIILRTMLDLSLLRKNQSKKPTRWTKNIKNAFESAIDKNLVDAFILLGLYFGQFYYLNSKWIIKQVKSINFKNSPAFVSGLTGSNAPNGSYTFKLLKPHYLNVIKGKKLTYHGFNNGLVNHITSFFFWGLVDVESVLMKEFLKNSTRSVVNDLIRFICQQEDYLNQLPLEERRELKLRILNLGVAIIKSRNSEAKDDKEIRSTSLRLIKFAEVLNDDLTNWMLPLLTELDNNRVPHNLLHDLNALSSNNNEFDFQHLTLILKALPIFNYYNSIDKNHLLSLVEIVFQAGLKIEGNEICDQLAKNGHAFLMELYKKYNPK